MVVGFMGLSVHTFQMIIIGLIGIYGLVAYFDGEE